MRKLALILALLFSFGMLADGTITTPTNVAPASWKIAAINMTTGAATDPAGISVTVYYFDGGGTQLPNQTQTIALTPAEIASFLTTIESPVAGESGTSVKRFRQRVTSWLVANNKISNVTPE